MKKPHGRKKLFLAFFLVLLIFVAAIYMSGPEKVIASLFLISPAYLLLLLLLTALTFAVRIARWGLLLEASGVKVTYRELVVPFLIGYTGALLTPVRAGEAIRCVLLKGHRAREVTGSFIVEKLFESVVVAVLAYSLILKYVSWAAIFPALSILPMLLLVLVLSSKSLVKRLWNFFPLKKYRAAIFHLQRAVAKMYLKAGTYGALVLTLVIFAMDFFRVYLIFAALGYSVHLLTIAQVFSAAIFAGGVLMLPGGLGGLDAAAIFLFSALGVPPYVVTSVMIVDRLLTYWIPLPVGLLLVPRRRTIYDF